MNNNILNIGSVNIGVFGFKSTFDTELRKLTLDITNLTTFKGDGINNVLGICFNVTGPGGLPIATADFTAPHIMPASASTFEIALPSAYALFGWYTIQGQIKEANGTVYSTLVMRKEICAPDNYNNASGTVPGVFNVDANCDIPQILVSENTVFAYKKLNAESVVKSGTLFYPSGTLNDLPFDFTPFLVGGSGLVYTGRYTINNRSVAQFNLDDGVYVSVTFAVKNFEKVIDCQSALSRLVCCVDEVKARYDRDPYSAQGKSAKQHLDNITIPFLYAVIKEKGGLDATTEIDQIKKELGCDCGCGSAQVEPKPIMGGGQMGTNINVVGVNASRVTSAVIGSTTQYTVNTKNVSVAKDVNDLAFSISRVENDSLIVYTIAFDYTELSRTTLTTIRDNSELLALFQSLVDAAGVQIDLEGLDGSCIGLNLSVADYILVETNANGKNITSIVIDGTAYAAPSNLAMTNNVAVAAWLNGLALGTFSASYDSGSKSLTIQSLQNTHRVSTLSISASGSPIVRLFTRNIAGIKEILQAIFTYICGLPMAKVKLGQQLNICEFDANGAPKTTALTANDNLATVITKMAAAQCILVNSIAKALKVDCATISNIFKPATVTPDPAKDTILGSASGTCASLTYDQLVSAILTKIATSSALKTQFCNIVSTCAVPVCDPPTNVSGSIDYNDSGVNITDIEGEVQS
jgi:hypothetical protein